MVFDPDKQIELERNERWLASLMRPRPSEEAVKRVREAVRAAMDEQWLQGVVTPAPTPAAIMRMKAAVHNALRNIHREARYRIFGALSAAATVLLAIGLARFASYGPSVMMSESPLGENFAAAWDAIEDDGGMKSLTTDMAWLDQEMDASANKTIPRTEEMELEALQDRVDQLLTTPDYFSGVS